jgi:hypothetical protein
MGLPLGNKRFFVYSNDFILFEIFKLQMDTAGNIVGISCTTSVLM